jgi:hypothetical protein
MVTVTVVTIRDRGTHHYLTCLDGLLTVNKVARESSNSPRSASESLALDLVTDAQRYTIGISRLVTPGLCVSCFPILNARHGNAGR